MNREEYLDYLQRKTNASKSMIIKYISMVGTNEENILNYARNSSNAVVRKDNGFNVDYTAVMINKKDEEIKCYKDLCETYKKQCHNFIDNELKTKVNQNQKAIECLKEVLDKVSKTKKHYSRDYGYIYSYNDIEDFIDYIDEKIKELEGNNDKAK